MNKKTKNNEMNERDGQKNRESESEYDNDRKSKRHREK